MFLGTSLGLVLLILDSVLCGQTVYPTAKLNSQSGGRVMSLQPTEGVFSQSAEAT